MAAVVAESAELGLVKVGGDCRDNVKPYERRGSVEAGAEASVAAEAAQRRHQKMYLAITLKG